ncbi:MAG TPA: type II toxin-antitoxin system RelE/ParE family toxin [Candidatus Syntrophoarchaeum butanivorans]|uniref:Plasmid stabilization system protein, RelE/ParE family n=1 Tax=Candidatus Syntropharchaeum butanivorans TaxID=1839936 RepID=A0A1F2P4L0_9EURY|nr:MAG: plasmid stabilization system protein, RelE/ParE family [Candidatus Syntrophoarchaeum butanivorans]HEC56822.1 type II toxin-antitoxin system RelE/ParE family toxin [Candidatus Syntrophoarchaeum butanivorans]
MTYTVYLKKSAEKELKDLPEDVHDRIVKQLLALKGDPRPRGSKKLRGREGYRIRVGDYRILYVIDESKKMVEIVSVAHRRKIYR